MSRRMFFRYHGCFAGSEDVHGIQNVYSVTSEPGKYWGGSVCRAYSGVVKDFGVGDRVTCLSCKLWDWDKKHDEAHGIS